MNVVVTRLCDLQLFNSFMDGALHEMRMRWDDCGIVLNHVERQLLHADNAPL